MSRLRRQLDELGTTAGGEIHFMPWTVDGATVAWTDLGPAGLNSTVNDAGRDHRFRRIKKHTSCLGQ